MCSIFAENGSKLSLGDFMINIMLSIRARQNVDFGFINLFYHEDRI